MLKAMHGTHVYIYNTRGVSGIGTVIHQHCGIHAGICFTSKDNAMPLYDHDPVRIVAEVAGNTSLD